MRNAIHAACCFGQYLSSCPGSAVKAALGLPEGRMCLSPLELCQYVLAKGVRKHGSEAIF